MDVDTSPTATASPHTDPAVALNASLDILRQIHFFDYATDVQSHRGFTQMSLSSLRRIRPAAAVSFYPLPPSSRHATRFGSTAEPPADHLMDVLDRHLARYLSWGDQLAPALSHPDHQIASRNARALQHSRWRNSGEDGLRHVFITDVLEFGSMIVEASATSGKLGIVPVPRREWRLQGGTRVPVTVTTGEAGAGAGGDESGRQAGGGWSDVLLRSDNLVLALVEMKPREKLTYLKARQFVWLLLQGRILISPGDGRAQLEYTNGQVERRRARGGASFPSGDAGQSDISRAEAVALAEQIWAQFCRYPTAKILILSNGCTVTVPFQRTTQHTFQVLEYPLAQDGAVPWTAESPAAHPFGLYLALQLIPDASFTGTWPGALSQQDFDDLALLRVPGPSSATGGGHGGQPSVGVGDEQSSGAAGGAETGPSTSPPGGEMVSLPLQEALDCHGLGRQSVESDSKPSTTSSDASDVRMNHPSSSPDTSFSIPSPAQVDWTKTSLKVHLDLSGVSAADRELGTHSLALLDPSPSAQSALTGSTRSITFAAWDAAAAGAALALTSQDDWPLLPTLGDLGATIHELVVPQFTLRLGPLRARGSIWDVFGADRALLPGSDARVPDDHWTERSRLVVKLCGLSPAYFTGSTTGRRDQGWEDRREGDISVDDASGMIKRELQVLFRARGDAELARFIPDVRAVLVGPPRGPGNVTVWGVAMDQAGCCCVGDMAVDRGLDVAAVLDTRTKVRIVRAYRTLHERGIVHGDPAARHWYIEPSQVTSASEPESARGKDVPMPILADKIALIDFDHALLAREYPSDRWAEIVEDEMDSVCAILGLARE